MTFPRHNAAFLQIPKTPDLTETLRSIPREALPWIARSHLEYLDGKFHDIERLTQYLATCRPIEKDRIEYIRFVDSWTYACDRDIDDYMIQFAQRYARTRNEVLAQCSAILTDPGIWESRTGFGEFWTQFAYVNEYDSLHGMFLTSGRWYTNAVLPAVRVLAEGFLQRTGLSSQHGAADLATEVITPEYVVRDHRVHRDTVREFGHHLRAVLRHCDQAVLDILDVVKVSDDESGSVEDLAAKVGRDPSAFDPLLRAGVFPPFAWHELRGEGKRTRLRLPLPQLPELNEREKTGFEALQVLKHFEADYNTFNYKGYFPLVSKYFWWRCEQSGYLDEVMPFRSAVLGDRFYEALGLVSNGGESIE
jgi:hypothetical protein